MTERQLSNSSENCRESATRVRLMEAFAASVKTPLPRYEARSEGEEGVEEVVTHARQLQAKLRHLEECLELVDCLRRYLSLSILEVGEEVTRLNEASDRLRLGEILEVTRED